jgi:hypothetical protein
LRLLLFRTDILKLIPATNFWQVYYSILHPVGLVSILSSEGCLALSNFLFVLSMVTDLHSRVLRAL